MTQKAETKPMYIGVVGDAHGKVLLPFLLGKAWQAATGNTLSRILSVGDLGVYRSFWAMEKTSRRFAKKHPEELGFSKYFFHFDGSPPTIRRVEAVEETLRGIEADLYFVPGNHEEHAYLKELRERHASSAQQPTAVDLDWSGSSDHTGFTGYERIYVLPEGPIVTLDGPLDEKTWLPVYVMRLRAINGLDGYTPEYAWGSSRAGKAEILISHTTYQGRLDHIPALADAGSARLGELIRRVGPKYHFFGHFHAYFPEAEVRNNTGGVTRSVGLNQVAFNNGALESGCFGVLTVHGPDDMKFEMVSDDITSSIARDLPLMIGS